MTNEILKFETFLLNERVEFLNNHQGIALIGNISVALMTLLFLWNKAPHNQVLLWAGLSLSIYFMSFILSNTLTIGTRFLGLDVCLVKSIFFGIALGLSWGMAPLIFYVPDSPKFLIVMCCIYTGYISSTLSLSFAYLPTFLGFSAAITIPFASRLFYSAGYEHTFISVTMLVYVAILIYAAHNIQQLFIKSARANYQNLFLLEQLSLEKATAIRANQSKDQFLAAASHDLRQPLNAANLFVGILEPLQTDSNAKHILNKVKLSLKNLNKMLHSLLDISKLNAGVMENKPTSISLATLIDSLLNEMTAQLSKVSIKNTLTNQHIVESDPILLERIIRNILDNAFKYTPEGQVAIDAISEGDDIRLTIKDTGIGIQDDKLELVFEEFEQLNNSERNRELGLGLGLAIVKRLCQLTDIELSLESKFGKGTTITLTIPSGAKDMIIDSEPITECDLTSTLVVVIDDEIDILEGMEQTFLNWGCRTVVGQSEDHVFKELSELNDVPDILISDFRLRDNQNGIDAIENLHEEYNYKIPAILITGDTTSERVAMAYQAECEVMYKPIDSDELRDVMYRIMSFEMDNTTQT